MKYLLDTNICIHFLKGQFGLIEKFEELGTENFAISEITFAELVFGAENSTNPNKNLEVIEVFSNQVLIIPPSKLQIYKIEELRQTSYLQ
jgi:tRNA(fMet)-specific endonuclease VapC